MKTLTILCLAILLFSGSLNSSQDSPELLEAKKLNESVIKLIVQRKFDEALPLAKKALEIRERLLPRTDPRVSSSLNYLGDVYLYKRNLKSAKESFRKLLQIQEERFGLEHANLATTLERLGATYFLEGNMVDAEASYQRSLAVREKAFGSSHSKVADSHYALGEYYRGKRDYAKSAISYRRALVIYGHVSGTDTPDFERTREAFSCVGFESGNDEIAKELSETLKQFTAMDEPSDPTAVLNGRAISLPKPDVPAAVVAHKIVGIVVIKVDIDETGKVTKARDMCKGIPLLSQVSVEAAMKARFTPTKLSGVPVKVTGLIKYNFVDR
jgi:tetratricopeptide (TPR) repeat protein